MFFYKIYIFIKLNTITHLIKITLLKKNIIFFFAFLLFFYNILIKKYIYIYEN